MTTAFRDEAFIRREVAEIEHWLATLPNLSPSN
jgi:hypothetical protein